SDQGPRRGHGALAGRLGQTTGGVRVGAHRIDDHGGTAPSDRLNPRCPRAAHRPIVAGARCARGRTGRTWGIMVAMPSVEECREAMDRVSGRIMEVAVADRRKHILQRGASGAVKDVETAFDTPLPKHALEGVSSGGTVEASDRGE